MHLENAHEHTGSAEAVRPSLHGGLRLISRSPRRPGSFATVASGIIFRQLDTSVGVSGPHDFAVRFSAVRQERHHVHRIPSRVRDDREAPLEWDETARFVEVIWGRCEAEYFCRKDWTGQISLIPNENFSSIVIALRAAIEVKMGLLICLVRQISHVAANRLRFRRRLSSPNDSLQRERRARQDRP